MRANEPICSLDNYRYIQETKEYRHTPLAFTEYLLKDNRISQTSKLAWITLSNYSAYSQDGKTQMSPKVLGTKIGKGKETARRALVELETYGYIKTDLSTKGQHTATIWVRFPEEIVKKILQEPDRSASKRSLFKLVPRVAAPQPATPSFEQPPIPDLEPVQDFELYQLQPLIPMSQHVPHETKFVEPVANPEPKATAEPSRESQEPELKEPQPVSFAPAAQNCGESGSKTSHINTINTNHQSKITVNNVSTTNLGNTNAPHDKLVERLLFVDCLFKKFIERANELKTQSLESSELKTRLWEPYQAWERQAIERLANIQNTSPINIPLALKVRSLYAKSFAEARASGLSPREASVSVDRTLTTEQVALKNTLQWVIGQLTDILEPPVVLAPEPSPDLAKPVAQPEQSSSVVINFRASQPRVTVSQGRADKMVARLRQAWENKELKGDAAYTQLQELAEQLVFHAEHWAPSTLQYANDEERINIAVNVAIKRMKEGSWKTPYGYFKQAVAERERQAQRWKDVERRVSC